MALPLILAAAGAAGVGAGSSMLAKKTQDKSKITRVEPPARKLSNILLSMEAVRRLGGRKSFADLLEEDRARSEGLRLAGIEEEGLRRQYGMTGTESPGMMERMLNTRESVTPALMGEFNRNQVARRESAIPMLQGLMGENPPYAKMEVKEAPLKYKMMQGATQGVMSFLGNRTPAPTTTTPETPQQTPTAVQPTGQVSPPPTQQPTGTVPSPNVKAPTGVLPSTIPNVGVRTPTLTSGGVSPTTGETNFLNMLRRRGQEDPLWLQKLMGMGGVR